MKDVYTKDKVFFIGDWFQNGVDLGFAIYERALPRLSEKKIFQNEKEAQNYFFRQTENALCCLYKESPRLSIYKQNDDFLFSLVEEKKDCWIYKKITQEKMIVSCGAYKEAVKELQKIKERIEKEEKEKQLDLF